MMHFNHSTGYYKKMAELQEKLKRSEEERSKLEEKFSLILKSCREEEEKKIVSFKQRYEKFLEDEKKRQERNERILQILDRIEAYAATLSAKSERLRLLRKHYEAYLLYLYPLWRKKTKMGSSLPQPSYPQLFSDSPENILSWQRTSSRTDLLGSSHHSQHSFDSPRDSSFVMKQPILNNHDPFSTPKLYENDATPNDELKSDQDSIIENYVNVAATLLNVPKEEIVGNEKSDEKSVQEQDTSRDLLNISFSDDGILQEKRFDSIPPSIKPLKHLDNSCKMTVKEIREVSEPDDRDQANRSGPLGSQTTARNGISEDKNRDERAQSITLLDKFSAEAIRSTDEYPVESVEKNIQDSSRNIGESAAFTIDSSMVEPGNGQEVELPDAQLEGLTDEQHTNLSDRNADEINIQQEEHKNVNDGENMDEVNGQGREGYASTGQDQHTEESYELQINAENQGHHVYENQEEYTADVQGQQYQALGVEGENYAQYSEQDPETQFVDETQHFQENIDHNQYEQTQYGENQEYEQNYYQQGYLPQPTEGESDDRTGMQEYTLEQRNADDGNYLDQLQGKSDVDPTLQRQYEEQYSNNENVGAQFLPIDDQKNLYPENVAVENPIEYGNDFRDDVGENEFGMYVNPEQSETTGDIEPNQEMHHLQEPDIVESLEGNIVQNVLPVHAVPDSSDARDEEGYVDGSQGGEIADDFSRMKMEEGVAVTEGIVAEDNAEIPSTQFYGVETDSSESSANPAQMLPTQGLYPEKSAHQMFKSEADSILTSDQDEVEDQLAALVEDVIPSGPELPVPKENLGDVMENDNITLVKNEQIKQSTSQLPKDPKARSGKDESSDVAKVGSKKIPSLIKVLESDTESLNINESVTDSNEFDFSTE